MAQLITYISDYYHDVVDNKSDPRVKDWFLMNSPLPTIIISLIYVYIVKVLGPKLMENRRPFEIRKVIVIYNLAQVLLSTWLFYEASVAGWLNHYSYRCQPVDYSINPLAMRMVKCCWWYYFSKLIDLLDTIFFVLRKKNKSISTLHVFHHGIMPISTWIGTKFIPGGHGTFLGFLNTFVHIVMYSYYLIAALGPQYKKYLWWKKYLTTIQMVQFVVIIIHALQLMFTDCNYPRFFVWWIIFQAVIFYFLFANFYKESYSKDEVHKLKLRANGNQQTSNQEPTNMRSNGITGPCYSNQTELYISQEARTLPKDCTSSEANTQLRNRTFVDSTTRDET